MFADHAGGSGPCFKHAAMHSDACLFSPTCQARNPLIAWSLFWQTLQSPVCFWRVRAQAVVFPWRHLRPHQTRCWDVKPGKNNTAACSLDGEAGWLS